MKLDFFLVCLARLNQLPFHILDHFGGDTIEESLVSITSVSHTSSGGDIKMLTSQPASRYSSSSPNGDNCQLSHPYALPSQQDPPDKTLPRSQATES